MMKGWEPIVEVVEQMQNLKVELVDVDRLVPYARNAKKHSEEQVDLICASIREFGWTNPCLVADGGLLAGHGRVMAARKLGLRRVPCIDLSHLSATQRRAYIVADNQIPNFGSSWDMDLLKGEIADLKIEGFDLELLGFGDELTDILDPELTAPKNKDPDAAPPRLAVAHSMLGDCWVCGPHKIVCGDSTERETWVGLMGSELADVVVTDPPFGVSYQAKGKKAIANDDLTGEKLRAFLAAVYRNLFERLKPGSTTYTFHADFEGLAFRQALADAGFRTAQVLTWVKDSLVLGRSRYQWRHEPVLVADVPGGKLRWWGGRKQTTVVEMCPGAPFVQQEDGRWAIAYGDEVLVVDGAATVEAAPGTILRHPKPRRSAEHPTMKPVALLERLLKNSARAGDLVVEPFAGSGSTLMAAERLGMSCRAVELDPGYVDVVVKRWQAWTGRAAVNAKTGQAFPVVPAECSREADAA